MFLGLFVGFDSLMEFLVFKSLLALLEGVHLLLLLQQSRFDFGHLLIGFQHLCEKVIGSANGDFGLDQDLHSFLDILPGHIVECHFSLDVIMDAECFR